MHLHVAAKQPQKLRMAIYGQSGSGKTMSSLLLAYGLCGDWSKVALIDTEDGSGSNYSYLGPFNTIQIQAPFHATLFQEAIELAEDAGKEVIIVDSLTPEWSGEGGIMDRLQTSEYENAIQEHRYVLKSMRRSSCHIICTMQARKRLAKFCVSGRGGWQLHETPVQQEGIEYPFTVVLKLDYSHVAHVIKDRTGVFEGKKPAKLEIDHGQFLLGWCKQIHSSTIPIGLQQKIDACQTHTELQMLLFSEDLEDMGLIEAFTKRRLEIDKMQGENEPFRA